MSALASSAVAQQTTPIAPSSVIGSVFDSIRSRAMSGARVRVDTSAQVATADADGRFLIEGIPPGPHHLRVEHPVLDTMGIALRSETETYVPGETRTTELATPAAETLIEMLCAPAWRARGPAALVGRVREADTGTPATGGKVSLVWYGVDVSNIVRRVPRVREANVGADGTYRICGLPAQLDGKIQVIRGTLTSGEILISFGDELFAMRNMSIAAPGAVVAVPAAPSTDPSRRGAPTVTVLGSARLTGRVVNKAGQPLVGARVQLEGTTRVSVTRPSGEFQLDSLPPGTQSVAVRLLGYAPIEEAVDLVSRQARSVTLMMTEFVPVLSAIRVTAQRERALDDVGFSRRRRVGHGYYLDEKAINHNTSNFSDALRGVPGLRIQPSQGRNIITSQRNPNGCVAIWIDGTMWQSMEPGDIDDFVKPHELAAVEVYSGTTAPAEFQAPGGGSCTSVVAWTYRRLERKR